jgi:hypothetical protein
VEWKNTFLPPQQQQLFCSISCTSLCDIGKVEVSILRISQHRQKLIFETNCRAAILQYKKHNSISGFFYAAEMMHLVLPIIYNKLDI